MAVLCQDAATPAQFAALANAERFWVQVRAVTGWPQESAQRLDRRLATLASASPTLSHDDYRIEWRRRYLTGWACSRPARDQSGLC